MWPLFDKYVRGIIDRRAFLKEAGKLAAANQAWQRTVALFNKTLKS